MKEPPLRRNTKQRTVILEELRKVKTHPTAQAIFRLVKRRLPSISFGTVYRNLNLLRDDAAILELSCDRYSSRYDADLRRHDHLFCLRCEKVFDIFNVKRDRDFGIEAVEREGFVVKYHRIDFYGYCKKCQERR